MNLKPAPFALTPAAVERMLDLADSARPADFPWPSAATEDKANGPIEPARVAPVQAAPSAQAGFPTPACAGNGEGGARG